MLGSAEFLGSPISFVRTMGTGLYDFFNEPRQHMDEPYEFVVGVARGSQSLVKHSVWALFNSTAKLSSTVGKGTASLTFDKPYIREREILSREKPIHVFQGLAFGMRDLGLGCVQGIGGLFVCTLRFALDSEGYSQEGKCSMNRSVGLRMIIGVAPLKVWGVASLDWD